LKDGMVELAGAAVTIQAGVIVEKATESERWPRGRHSVSRQ